MGARDHIFVYGTLRKAVARPMHDVLARHCAYLGAGAIAGRLYEVGGYPGAVAATGVTGTIAGEVYTMTDAALVLPLLDAYEECSAAYPEPHEYRRRQLPVRLAGGGVLTAWTYLYNRPVTGLQRIRSGDYVEHLRRPKPRTR